MPDISYLSISRIIQLFPKVPDNITYRAYGAGVRWASKINGLASYPQARVFHVKHTLCQLVCMSVYSCVGMGIGASPDFLE